MEWAVNLSLGLVSAAAIIGTVFSFMLHARRSSVNIIEARLERAEAKWRRCEDRCEKLEFSLRECQQEKVILLQRIAEMSRP